MFALSGAVAAVKRELDFFGVLVLSFVAATTGGIIRDVLIGAIVEHLRRAPSKSERSKRKIATAPRKPTPPTGYQPTQPVVLP